jgi:hypothetical protein
MFNNTVCAYEPQLEHHSKLVSSVSLLIEVPPKGIILYKKAISLLKFVFILKDSEALTSKVAKICVSIIVHTSVNQFFQYYTQSPMHTTHVLYVVLLTTMYNILYFISKS